MGYTADKGEKVLDITLPLTSGVGPPMTYMLDGKQYIAVMAGPARSAGEEVVEVAVAVVGIVARRNPPRQRPAMFRPLRLRRMQGMLRHPPTRQDKLGRPHLPHRRRTNRDFSFTRWTSRAANVNG